MKHPIIDRGDGIVTYEGNDGNLTVTHKGKWLPGVYDSPEAAICACRKEYSVLNGLWKQKKEKGEYVIYWREIDALPSTRIIL